MFGVKVTCQKREQREHFAGKELQGG